MADARAHDPDVRPLGYLSASLGLVALLLAVSYLMVGWAYPFALAGLVLGGAGCTVAESRRDSALGVGLSVAAVVVATVIILSA